MFRFVFALLVAAFAVGGHEARAQAPEAGDDNRYTFHRVDEGFLRLDTRTGQVSLCSRKTVGFGCHVVPDERTALENEIGRLQNESASLKKELLARGIALPGAVKDDNKPEAPVAKRTEPDLKLPSQADLDRVRVVFEKVWRRLVEMIVNLQKDMMQKT